jgi:hypothetical protein
MGAPARAARSTWLAPFAAIAVVLAGACSTSTGSSCGAAGGTCVLGGTFCAKEAASSAQDCNSSPPNPGGAYCCLAPADGASGTPAEDGAAGDAAPDGADAAAPTPPDAAFVLADAGCTVVVGADFDQSCTTDTDCVTVSAIPTCDPSQCVACSITAINVSQKAVYETALSTAFARSPPFASCDCNLCASGLAVCRGGRCETTSCLPPIADTLAACRDAGGTCLYGASSSCGTGVLEPPGDCAYDDEICCAN